MNIMFCLFCKEYNGLKEPCGKGKDIQEIKEVVTCEHYKYNGECKA